MPPTDPQFATYAGALHRHGPTPVVVELRVTDLLLVVSLLQLARRQAWLPGRIRQALDTLLSAWITTLERCDPVLGEVARLDFDPRYASAVLAPREADRRA